MKFQPDRYPQVGHPDRLHPSLAKALSHMRQWDLEGGAPNSGRFRGKI